MFQGCSSQKPTEPLSTTVITGTGSITIDQSSGSRDDYTFSSAGRNYGKIDLVTYDGTNGTFEAYGIVQSSATVAPESFPGTSAAVSLGYSYIIKTDTAPHYGRVTVTAVSVNSAAHTITVQFDWVVQTEAGNRSLQ
ncbi:MAG: hypothetical protein MUF78_00480 [Candidatus Edwardsbacteria bacterium]|nr:hypothetical protein [Candidatus Edwardsbacteria bacterium]